MTPSLPAVLDRTKVSDRKATCVLVTVAQRLDHDVQELNINHSTIHRAREQYRAEIGSQLRDQFQANVCLKVYWDGKFLCNLTEKELVDRLLVLVAGAGVNQVLGVPKLTSSTGEAQASAVARLIENWGVAFRLDS